MIALDAALARYGQVLAPLPAEDHRLIHSLHRVLAADVASTIDLPRHSQSALDGYVLHAEDAARGSGSLTVTEAIHAGDTQALTPLTPGHCQRILTGARVPPNAGAVIAQERVTLQGGKIELREALKPGANIRWQGEEAKQGQTLAKAGQTLTPALIASLAAAGCAQVPVRRAPRIAVLVSGDELRPLGATLADGQIWDSNGPLVMSWLAARGLHASKQHLPDDAARVREVLAEALAQNDLVISTGGVSVGDRDYLIPSAETLGVHRVFWQVAQKPGKPLYFGTRNKTALLGLPGNPAAVLIGLTLHVRAALDVLSGAANPGAPWQPGVLSAGAKADAKRDRLLRMSLSYSPLGRAQLEPLPMQDSHMLSNLSQATVLGWLPSREADYAAGEVVRWAVLW